jgi:hypothetical protein
VAAAVAAQVQHQRAAARLRSKRARELSKAKALHVRHCHVANHAAAQRVRR